MPRCIAYSYLLPDQELRRPQRPYHGPCLGETTEARKSMPTLRTRKTF